MLWVLYGILHSVVRAAAIEAGRIFNAEGSPVRAANHWQLRFLQIVTGLLLLLPLIPFMAWPSDPLFYSGAIGVSLIMAGGIVIQLVLVGQRSARVYSIAMPAEALIAFVLWCLAVPGVLSYYTANTVPAVGLLLAFAGGSIALLCMRPGDVTLRTLLLIIPVGFTYAVAAVVTKILLLPYNTVPVALAFLLLNFGTMAIVTGMIMLLKKKTGAAMTTAPVLLASGVTGLLSLLGSVTFVLAIIYVSNPAYISMLAMLLPVWLLVGHRLARVPDDARGLAAVALVASLLLLVICAL